MKIIRYPKKEDWQEILARPVFETKSLERHVENILNGVKKDGDEAVRHFTKILDKVELDDFAVSEAEFAEADAQVSTELKNAIQIAKANIEKFHAAQSQKSEIIFVIPAKAGI